MLQRSLIAVACVVLAALQPEVTASPAIHTKESAASREYFYIGGSYVQTNTGEHIYANQMYVEKLVPLKAHKSFPLVFIHGQAQTGTNWLNKPDGNPGWATYFLKKGYVVYIIDQTERGRSAWNPMGNTTLSTYTAELISKRFTATELYNLWPQAKLHTQWPGTGQMDDPIFDAYYSSNVEFQSNTIIQETKMQAAGKALLEKIGPAVLIAHSQGGFMPWLIADVASHLVKAIVSLEPSGPPFTDAVFTSTKSRIYGLTNIPLTYFPSPTNSTMPLQTQIAVSSNPDVDDCILQAEPARKLVNLENIPVLIQTGEASYHAVYDDCTFLFLKQAGVPVERLRLEDVGIHGNGHLCFMEKNSDMVAGVIEKWIKKVTGNTH